MPQNRENLNTSLANLEAAEAALIAAVGQYMTEVNNMIARFLAKIAAGVDFQVEVDKLNALNQTASDNLAQVQSAIAQVQVEGQ